MDLEQAAAVNRLGENPHDGERGLLHAVDRSRYPLGAFRVLWRPLMIQARGVSHQGDAHGR